MLPGHMQTNVHKMSRVSSCIRHRRKEVGVGKLGTLGRNGADVKAGGGRRDGGRLGRTDRLRDRTRSPEMPSDLQASPPPHLGQELCVLSQTVGLWG